MNQNLVTKQLSLSRQLFRSSRDLYQETSRSFTHVKTNPPTGSYTKLQSHEREISLHGITL